MIALARTRGLSAGNWQILLTNNNLNAAADGLCAFALEIFSERDTFAQSRSDTK